METILLVIHLLLALTLVIVVLLQKSEGGGLGIGGPSGGGPGNMMSGRTAADVLTRTTAVLAGLFIATSLALAIMAGGAQTTSSVIETEPEKVEVEPMGEPLEPAERSVPLSE